MLDVITDFWKPVRKATAQEKPDLENLQLNSVIGFGFVPQALLSGRRFKVSAINTYQFGDERMTSFVLSQDKEDSVSMIVASAEGEQYLAISRRIPFADRMKMFDPTELEAVVEHDDAVKLVCRDLDGSWKNWVVQQYKKDIGGVKGSISKGDYRRQAVPANALLQSFDYALLISENNEYAIEIEKYADGRIELYATIYRRLSDIGEIEHPQAQGGDTRLSAPMTTPPLLEVVTPEAIDEPNAADVEVEELISMPEEPEIVPTIEPTDVLSAVEEFGEETITVTAPASEAASLTEQLSAILSAAAAAKEEALAEARAKEAKENAEREQREREEEERLRAEREKSEREKAEREKAEKKSHEKQYTHESNYDTVSTTVSSTTTSTPTENAMLQTANGNTNEKENVLKPKFNAAETVRLHAGRSADAENDSIECELRVANKIIEEAIRNEMRLSDVVRRIIALPVANPESVQIPITLSDADFQLLAIRYGIPASDRETIKARIIDELNDFSGSKNQ